jgi:serine/threonine protein kinase/tetratricopeptide (TPR) repeat protein
MRFPRLGATLAGFTIVSELGRGAFGRVYLATQADLADRAVALKVSKALGDEPRNLARLQHTHIMPIHSVHDDPETGLRLMCMPYVGGANLAQVLQSPGARLPSQATGRSLVEALDRVGGAAPDAGPVTRTRSRATSRRSSARSTSDSPRSLGHAATRGLGTPSAVRSLWGRYFARTPWWHNLDGPDDPRADDSEPARRYLRTATYVQASVWIAARLAEALEHAHERGLLHRDLKPSNILIAADGTPMLLDFNLSAEIDPNQDDGTRAMVGGTLPYMAPEHLDAFNPDGETSPSAVDERSDVYALGLILFEMVAGQHPFTDPPAGSRMSHVLAIMTAERRRGAPSARQFNPLVSWSLDSILKKSLDPVPDRRYASAQAFADDLRLFLEDLPLEHAHEPSVRESAAKWARRHPRSSSASSVALFSAVLLLALAGSAWSLSKHLAASSARLQRSAFRSAFNECQLLLNTVSGPQEHIGRGIKLADETIRAYGADKAGDWTKGPLVQPLDITDQLALREEMSELIQLRARAEIHRSQHRSQREQRQAIERAITWLHTAERFDPRPSAALYADRAYDSALIGKMKDALRDTLRERSIAPSTARDWYLIGTAELARGSKDKAERDLSRAVVLDSRRFWAWFALGLCHDAMGRYTEAAGDFAACTALYPEFAWPHLNRGLALANAGMPHEARVSYDRALLANPNFIEALVNRGLTCLELGENDQAERDLNRALELGRRDPSVMVSHAEALSRLGRREDANHQFTAALQSRPDDPTLLVARGFFHLNDAVDSARSDFELVLKDDPSNARALLGMAYVLRRTDARAALEQLDRALAAAPDFADALQLRALIRARLGDGGTESDVDRLVQVPTAHRLYNAACALALLSKTTGQPRLAERALEILKRAVDAGFPRAHLESDPDLDAIRNRPEFRSLLKQSESRPPGIPASADNSACSGHDWSLHERTGAVASRSLHAKAGATILAPSPSGRGLG